MQIDNQLSGADNAVYYSEGFRQCIEDALTWLITNPQTQTQPIDPGLAYRYEADFNGLMIYYNVPYQYHWICMRMSGLVSPDEMTAQQSYFLKPSDALIQQMVSNFTAANAVAG